jgi:predicted nucleic acid-binding protein
MVLVDTSVWITFLRYGNSELEHLLNNSHVMCHPFIIGEIACGNLKNRMGTLSLLRRLPQSTVVLYEEVLAFIEIHNLMGKGLGWVDMHLCASAMLTRVPIWTLDKGFNQINKTLKLSYESS